MASREMLRYGLGCCEAAYIRLAAQVAVLAFVVFDALQ